MSTIVKIWLAFCLFLGFLWLVANEANAQNVRYSAQVPSITTIGSVPYLVANVPPNSPVLAVCNVPANSTPCTNYATTYNSAGVACSNGAQDTPDPQPSSCQSTGDAQGNIGFFAPAGNYDYTVCIQTTCLGPYRVTLSSGGALPGGGTASPGVAFPTRFTYTFGRGDGILAYGHGVGAVGTQGNFSPTATETSGRTVSSSAVGSTNTVVSTCSGMGANPGQDFLTYGTISRFTMRIETQTTTTVRYWVGIMDLGAGECTSGNSTYTSDTPNRSYCAFRFSTTTDTTWKAACGTSNVLQTVVDTGVTPVTSSSTVFEIFPGSTSTTFYINGSLVATIATNQPTSTAPVSFGFQGDNKNTATAETVVFFWDQLFESK